MYRQACSVESAAVSNPNSSIILLYVSEVGYLNSTPLPIFDALAQYENIYVANIVDYIMYSIDTPIQEWIFGNQGNAFKNEYGKEQILDYLKYLRLVLFSI